MDLLKKTLDGIKPTKNAQLADRIRARLDRLTKPPGSLGRLEEIAFLEAGVQLIGPECAIPLQTAIENLKEIPRTVREWHKNQAAN